MSDDEQPHAEHPEPEAPRPVADEHPEQGEHAEPWPDWQRQGWQDPQAGAWQDPHQGWYQQGWQQYPAWGQQGWQPAPRLPLDSREARSRPSRWTWPLVAVLALVLGVVGGLVGGSLVGGGSTTTSAGGILDVQTRTAPPLPADNGSVPAVAQELLPSTVQVVVQFGSAPDDGATGSGFVLDRQGHVITNNHVVADVKKDGLIEVVDGDGKRHDASVVGRSAVYDLAVLDVPQMRGVLPAALGSSSAMRVGETVVALGSPLGLESSVTSGILSAIDRPVTTGPSGDESYINALQTDAAINPGNSGGPLVNLRGQVIGVNSAIATMGGGLGGEGGNIGVGFAIPVEQVQVTAHQILATGESHYPVIGANVNIGRSGGAVGDGGAKIVDVPSDGPASAAGLEKGDVVVAVDGKPVVDGIGLIVAIRSHQPGEKIALVVRRDGQRRQVRVRLDSEVG